MSLRDLAYGDELFSEEEEPENQVSVFSDVKGFLKKQCGLATGPHGRAKNGLSSAWLDWRPGSMCRQRWEFILSELPPGKWGKLLLESRGAGKSMAAKCLTFGEIQDDPSLTIHYTAQNKEMSPRAVKWVKGKIQIHRPDLVPPAAERSDWGSQHFTVVRPQGEGDNPTMMAGSPDADVTGSRPDKVRGDDLVVKENNKHFDDRKKIIEWWELYQDQFHAGTDVLLIGTRNEGHNLYEEIIRHYADDFVFFFGDCYDENMDINYPWMTPEYLARQERKNARVFLMQYRNKWMPSEGAVFADMTIVNEDPPVVKDDTIEGGWKLDPRLNVYMLVDPAQSTSPAASEWAFIVIAKDYDDVTYVVDIDIGKYDPSGGKDHFFAMYGRWIPHGLQYAILEDRGPAKDLFSLLPDIAALDKNIDFKPALVEIKRGSTEAKNSRIDKLHPVFKEGRMRFSEKFVPPEMFRVSSRNGQISGVAVDRVRGYSAKGDLPRDFMDALADSQGIIVEKGQRGAACPHPYPPRTKQKVLTDQEWAVQQALGRGNRTHFV